MGETLASASHGCYAERDGKTQESRSRGNGKVESRIPNGKRAVRHRAESRGIRRKGSRKKAQRDQAEANREESRGETVGGEEMSTLTATHWITVDEFGDNPRYEHGYYLLDGKVYQDLGNTKPIHELVKATTHRLLLNELDRLKITGMVCSESPYVMDDQTMLMPDVSVQIPPRGAIKDWWRGAPEIVIEIVSPANRREDFERTLQRYAANGAKAIWVLDPDRRAAYQVTPDGVRVPLTALRYEGIEIDLAQIWEAV
jgi:Uma2 family endonuclease